MCDYRPYLSFRRSISHHLVCVVLHCAAAGLLPCARRQLIDCCTAGPRQHAAALNSTCEQCHIDSWRRKLNTVVFLPFYFYFPLATSLILRAPAADAPLSHCPVMRKSQYPISGSGNVHRLHLQGENCHGLAANVRDQSVSPLDKC